MDEQNLNIPVSGESETFPCPRCKAPCKKDANFCGICGFNLKYSYQEPTPAATNIPRKKAMPVWAIVLIIVTAVFLVLGVTFTAIASFNIIKTVSSEIYEQYGDNWESLIPDDKKDKIFGNQFFDRESYEEVPNQNKTETTTEKYIDNIPVFSYGETIVIGNVEFIFSEPSARAVVSGKNTTNVTVVPVSIYNGMEDNALTVKDKLFSIADITHENENFKCDSSFASQSRSVEQKTLFPGQTLTGELCFADCSLSAYDSLLFCSFKADGNNVSFYVIK